MIPTTGNITSEIVRSEWGFTLPFTSAQVASAAGLATPWTSEQLRGKSARSVSIFIQQYEQVPGFGPFGQTFHDRITFGVSVTGGGTPTSYGWGGDVWGQSATGVFTGPEYDIYGFTIQPSGEAQVSVAIAGQIYLAALTFTYTTGGLS